MCRLVKMQIKLSKQAVRLLQREQFGRCIYIKNHFARFIYTFIIKQILRVPVCILPLLDHEVLLPPSISLYTVPWRQKKKG